LKCGKISFRIKIDKIIDELILEVGEQQEPVLKSGRRF